MRISDWSSDVCSSDLAADHGARGGARYAFRRGLGRPARMQGNQRDRHAEHHAFDYAVQDIVEYIDAVLHLRPERAGVYTNKQYAHDPPADDAHHGKYRSQNRDRKSTRLNSSH